MEYTYNLKQGKYVLAPETDILAARNNFVHDQKFSIVSKKVEMAGVIAKNSLQGLQKVKNIFGALFVVLAVALAVAGAVAMAFKYNPTPFRSSPANKSPSLAGDQPFHHHRYNISFWQCFSNPKTINKTHIDVNCQYAPWRRPSPFNSTENFNSFEDLAFEQENQNRIDAPVEKSFWNNINENLKTNLGSINESLRKMLYDDKEAKKPEEKSEENLERHRRRRRRELFLTIDDAPFVIAHPCPIPPCVRCLIFWLSCALSHTLLALIIICCCHRKQSAKTSKQIHELFSNDNDGVVVFASADCSTVRVIAAEKQPTIVRGEYRPEQFATQSIELRREPAQRQKKVKYVMVEEDGHDDCSMHPLKN